MAGGRFGEDPPTLEWICFHVLAEYARHGGHLDIVEEIARVSDGRSLSSFRTLG
ncbi:MAG: DinB family protein [Cryobacterium sp.]|nr:DinB family protein [Cryobacterium sp.]